jgi:gluconokinase
MIVILMGVAGSGKTTVGRLLSEAEGWPFFDADDFHTPENKEKMRRGAGLTDAERGPWLDALRARIDELLAAGLSAVFACSALKQAYRDRLQAGPDVRFVYLKGSFDLIERRLAARADHYAGPALLRSQFEALEEPGGVPVVDAALTPDEMLAATRQALELGRTSTSRSSSAPGRKPW